MNTKILYGALAIALATSMGCDKKPEATPPVATNNAPKPATNNAAPAQTQGATAAAAETNAGAAAEAAGTNLAEIDPATLNEEAPAEFSVKFATTEGDFNVELHRDWAPHGVDRFYNLVKAGYYTDIAAFRVINGFMAQFGIHGNPAVNKVWREAKIQDDPSAKGISNGVGYLTYAMAGPNTRTVQLFINFGNNKMLDSQGFTPIGKVADGGMDVVKKWYAEYGEGAPRGKGPDQMRVQTQGNEYLKKDFPKLSYINSITIVGGGEAAAPAGDTGSTKPTPAAAKKAWEAGAFTQRDLSGADFEGAMVRLSIKDDGSVTGSFQGKREGKGFSVPFKGTINDQGQVTAEGSRGTNNVKVTGMYKAGGVHGNIQGSINAKGLRVAFQAMK